jgi:excisionase family DNA binding protein
MEPLAYTLDEVAAVTRLSKSEIKRRIAAGEIIVAKVGRRTLVRRERVDEFLLAQELGGAA